MSRYKNKNAFKSMNPVTRRNKKTRELACLSRAPFPRTRSAQVGETVSWIVATLVIIAVLMIFIYISVLISKTKAVSIGSVRIIEKADLLKEKTSLAHQLANERNKEIIDNILKENG